MGDVDPSCAPSFLFAAAMRRREETIREVASCSLDDDAWIRIDAGDGFVEPISLDELAEQLPHLQRARLFAAADRLGCAEVRCALTWAPMGNSAIWILLIAYPTSADVPEAPVGHEWVEPVYDSEEAAFPSLRGAPGLCPLDADALAAWALASSDPQAPGSAAFVIEASVGLKHADDGPVGRLFDSLAGRGLATHMREVWDEEHREAATLALALKAALAVLAAPWPAPVAETLRTVEPHVEPATVPQWLTVVEPVKMAPRKRGSRVVQFAAAA